ncbi:Methyltransferase type 11 [uncultured Caudovirales phage]|uniref:Methyltransferase type 11 n=1 Tax=uncultured Caudovirales phage TaxID=2100421 RepID=A0A6J5KPX5_9CAUD|nr:Methyltransferase type 11 [uncultured Caudovirales phage]
MKINIGAGDQKFEGFKTIDYDARTNPDFCFNIESDVFPFPDNSVEEVIAHHVFEHLGEGYFHVLKELYRVCKPGAMINVRVPHPRHDTFLADPTHRRPITPMGLWLFSKTQNDEAKNSASSKLAYYYDVDFEIVDVQEIPDEFYIKQFTGQQAEIVKRYIHEHNNIILEYQIMLTVIKK